MNNMIKLVQASGKGLIVPASSISIVRTLEPNEQEQHEKGKSHVWLVLGGVAQTAVVREQFGFILRKAGGDSGQRVQLAGTGGTKISMPRDIFAHAIEIETPGTGENAEPEDVTVVHTSLHSNAGPVAFYSKESATDLYDMLSTEQSDDDGSDEDENEAKDEGQVEPTSKPGRGRKAKAAETT